MPPVNSPKYTRSLSRTRLTIPAERGAISLALANGANMAAAFTAVVYFRDAEGALIFPPYDGFARLGPHLSGFTVGGGDNKSPAITTYGYQAPEGAQSLEIELRANEFNSRPVLAAPPSLTPGRMAFETAGSAETKPVLNFPVSSDTRALTVSVLNGKAAGAKAFIAKPQFFDADNRPLAPPYEGFTSSPQLGAFFYLEGGSAASPARTTHAFMPPEAAVRLSLVFEPSTYKGKIALAAVPGATGMSSAEALRAVSGREDHKDQLTQAVSIAPGGSRISERITSAPKVVVGFIGPALAERLGTRAALTQLPFDSYDRKWQNLRPTALILQPEALVQGFGWEHALSLRDPAATAELAVLLERARLLGLRTILVRPEDPSRFPLLSRLSDLFDQTLEANDASLTEAAA